MAIDINHNADALKLADTMTKDYYDKCQRAYDIVFDYFNGNTVKTALWFEVNNPALGNVSAKYMIAVGRVDKLLKFLESQKSMNKCETSNQNIVLS